MDKIQLGTLFEKFDVLECLKKDQHSGVFIANHIYLHKKIILKILKTEDLADKTILERFKREAKILARLDHPNLIRVLDFGSYEKYFYISFEYFKSRNLREVIRQNNLSNDDKKNIFIQLLRALNIAHQNQIIHRDIKPENILVDENKHLKIADFGLAAVENEENITQSTSVVGTPGYMAPEQLRGEKSLQSDIFSAGVVVYEMYCGRNPFSKDTVSDTINKILNYDEKSEIFDLEKLPGDVRDALQSMLRKNLKDRAKSVNEVLSLLGIEGDVYEPVTVNKKSANKIIYYSLTAVLVITVLLLVLKNPFLGNSENDTNQTITPGKDFAQYDSLGLNGNKQNIPAKSDSSNIEKIDNKKSENNNDVKPESSTGRLFVECRPWADVFIDNEKVDQTPLKNNYIILKKGKHLLKLVHPSYPPYTKRINISSDTIESVSIDFDQLVGYFKCDIYPWGEVFINNESKGMTPIRKPIALFPGKYNLTIKNPKYADHSEVININRKDTLLYNFNFEISTKGNNKLSKSE